MDQGSPITHHLVIYTAEMRWTGFIPPAPSHRRLSDHINDKNIDSLLLSHVVPAYWENGALVSGPEIESAYVIKHHAVLIAPGPKAPPIPPPHPMNVVPKNPFRVMIHLPTLQVEGCLHFGRASTWPDALNTMRSEFLPVTDATIFHTATVKQVAKTGFVLVNRELIMALEPIPAGG